MIPSKDTDDFKLWSEPEKLKGKKDHHQIQTIQIIIRIPWITEKLEDDPYKNWESWLHIVQSNIQEQICSCISYK